MDVLLFLFCLKDKGIGEGKIRDDYFDILN